jgi:RimJ/RimL family protein N-acetyltransferase
MEVQHGMTPSRHPVRRSEVTLREVVDSDLPIFYEHQLDPEGSRMAAFPSRDRHAHMVHWTKIMSDDTTINRTILADGAVVGNVGSWITEGKRAIGYWIAREHWGKGVATEAVRQFLDEVKQRPLFATVAAHNVASRRVLEKCGFTIVKGPYLGPAIGDVEAVEELLLALPAPGAARPV